MFLNTFQFTGAVLRGSDLYIALWGGAGSSPYYSYVSRGVPYYLYPKAPFGGSGGFILAKVKRIAKDDQMKLYVGGRGGAGLKDVAMADVSYFSGLRAGSTSSFDVRNGGSGGAASALTVRLADDLNTEIPLLIAPSGGGCAGGTRAYYLTTSANSLYDQTLYMPGGHGMFTGVDLGRSTIAPPELYRYPANHRYYPNQQLAFTAVAEPGNAGPPPTIGTAFEENLFGGWGANSNGGGAGAPDGEVTYYDRTISIYHNGGGGGKGYVAGWNSTDHGGAYASGDYGVGLYGDIEIEFVAFDGQEPRPWETNTDDQFLYNRVNSLRSQDTDAGNLAEEITDVLGWNSASAGQLNFPPDIFDNDTNRLVFNIANDQGQNSLDDAALSAPRLDEEFWPGQAAQRKKDDNTNLPNYVYAYNKTLAQVDASMGTTRWFANSGAGLMRFGQDGGIFAFRPEQRDGAYTNNLVTSETEGVSWGPTSTSLGSFRTAISSFSAGGGAAPNMAYTDDLSIEYPAYDTGYGMGNLHLGPNTLVQSDRHTRGLIIQVRNNDANVYEYDLETSGRTVAAVATAPEDYSDGVPSSSGTRNQLAYDGTVMVIAENTGTAIIDLVVNPDTQYTRLQTNTVLTSTTNLGMCLDDKGFCYITDVEGNLDVFNAHDFINGSPVVYTEANLFSCPGGTELASTAAGYMAGLAYDPEHDCLWYERNGRISWMQINRNDDLEPIGFTDNYLNTTANYHTTPYNAGNNNTYKIFWVSPNILMRQQSNAILKTDTSGINPKTPAQPDFVFSMWGAGGSGGNTQRQSTLTTEDAGPGGNGAFVEVRVRFTALEQQNVKFGLSVGEGGWSALQQVYRSPGGGGGGATVLYVKVDGVDYVLAVAAGGGGGGGAGRTSTVDAGYGGSAGGVDLTTGVGNNAQNGLSPNATGAGNGGGGASGTSAGTPPAERSTWCAPPTKTGTLQQGGVGGTQHDVETNLGNVPPGGQSRFGGDGGNGSPDVNQNAYAAGGGGGGGGYWAGAGGSGTRPTYEESAAGGGGGSSWVWVGTHSIGGIAFTVDVLNSDDGTLNTGAPSAAVQAAGTVNHFSYSTRGGQGGLGGRETSSYEERGFAGADGQIVCGHYADSTHTQVLNQWTTTLIEYERDSRIV